MEEGDQIHYSPSLKGNEKRNGEIAVVLASANQNNEVTILDSKSASKPAQWSVPFRASLAMYVYGPSGLEHSQATWVLEKDQELIAQLAEYAEKTSQTEQVLQVIANMRHAGDSLEAALQGFARQSGINSKIDRNASANEQMLAALRTLNPALSAYDPIGALGSQRLAKQQACGGCRGYVSREHSRTGGGDHRHGAEFENAPVPRYGFSFGLFATDEDYAGHGVPLHHTGAIQEP